MNKIRKCMRLVFILAILLAANAKFLFAQASGQLRWSRVGSLQAYFSEQGCEVETGGPAGAYPLFWPGEYGMRQLTTRCKAMWIGCKDYSDIRAQKTFSRKVVGIGPRQDLEWQNQIFPVELKLVGRFNHPTVMVDDQQATHNELYDALDSIDQNLVSDRMVLVKVHTAIGVTITKRVYIFTQQYHDNYFIYDYELENTGIVDNKGTVNTQTLNDVYFYLQYRHALSGESVTDFAQTASSSPWGTWNSTWGINTVNQVIGTNPSASDFKFRAFYSWYGLHSQRALKNAQDDWGCPDQYKTGVMAAAKYVGCVTLHADRSATDASDDKTQPKNTMYMESDDNMLQAPQSQFSDMAMASRYEAMSAGHPAKTHADEVGEQFADTWGTGIAGYSQGLGYGPYTMAPGQKIHIIIAEGVAGLSREKNREVGTNWLAYYNNTSTPVLKMPNGSATTEYTAYKKAWVQTGVDSILQTFQRAVDNYISGYAIPKPPPPPDQFNVASGADQIFLKWSDNATTWPHFNGYVIYRSKGNVLVPETVYEKIFECSASYPAAAGSHEYKDTSAQRGFVYYYYIQTKDDGSTNNIQPGVPLVSSKFWTIASQSARLLRPSGNKIQEVRVVPNPYDLRSRRLQFADAITGFDRDQIAFYGLPPKCNLRIYTERRDLIWQKDHQNGTGDEFWNSQTQYGQIVVSGIYILHVEVTEDIFATEDKYARRDISDDDGKTIYRNGDLMFRKGDQIYRKGDSIFRKFVIIR